MAAPERRGTPLASSCAASAAAPAVEEESSSCGGGDMAASGAAIMQRGQRRLARGQAPALLALLVWAGLGVLVAWAGGGGRLPGAAAQPDGDEGAPFPISTTSQGIGRGYVRSLTGM